MRDGFGVSKDSYFTLGTSGYTLGDFGKKNYPLPLMFGKINSVTWCRSHPFLPLIIHAFSHGWTLYVPHHFLEVLVGLSGATEYFPKGL